MNSLILKTATRILTGLILVFSIYLLFRGHNAPGGGFSGALVAGTAFALFAIAEGPARVRSAIRISPEWVTLAGLGVALGSGFLTGLWLEKDLSAGAGTLLGTPLLFDIGVFLTVLGTLLSLILALEEN
jgi:multisubunit Na+/H+ antiporter MnhB subunit